jgi:hypothetical protein
MSNDSSDPIDPDAILGAPPPGEILSRLLSLLQRRNELDSRADRMIRIIDEIACDPENDPKARLAAAQDLIDRSGKYPKVKDDGGDKKGAEITIEADWRDRLFKIQAKGS